MTMHWVGTGLSAIPGLRRLLAGAGPVVVWNRFPDETRAALGGAAADIRVYDLPALAAAVARGDIVVSMLPADLHVALARMCIDRGAHFVSSSYVSTDMAGLDGAARQAGVALVNEIGLDPGIDHLMAHDLVADYRACARPGDRVSFTSYCGGIPCHPGPFRYKFSWSPLGVLRALRSASRSIRAGHERIVERPWQAVEPYDAPLPVPERFEVYPNRDSTAFIGPYGFDPSWQLQDFVRGTIRTKGWAEAWQPVFAAVERLAGPGGDDGLARLADRLWAENAYAEGEPDRAVLFVRLAAERDGAPVYDREWVLDARGNGDGTAMARLVSTPVALAAEAVAEGRFRPGVHAATDDPDLIGRWLVEVGRIADHVARVNHLAIA